MQGGIWDLSTSLSLNTSKAYKNWCLQNSLDSIAMAKCLVTQQSTPMLRDKAAQHSLFLHY